MNNKSLVWILFIFLSLTWGSSFILMKRAMYPAEDEVMVFGPFQVGALRITLAGLVLLPLALRARKMLTRKSIPLLFVTGFFGNLLPAMMFTLAETNIDSSLAGLLNSTTSFFVVVIGVFFYRSKPSIYQLIGLALGSTGLYLVLSSHFDIDSTKDIRYAFFIFPATLGYAISLTTIKFKLQHIPPLSITSLSFLLNLPLSIIAVFATKAYLPIFEAPNGLSGFGYLSILSILGTAIAVMLFNKLISISNHIFSSAIAYMLPVVAIFIGVLDGENFPVINLIWMVLIILGVLLMNQSPEKLKQRAENKVGKK
ncbi:MAG: DMT family transporter [Crocinitomicaceae bacterium]|nr:DMT family transporter [Crocinitomicaceae bacterium]